MGDGSSVGICGGVELALLALVEGPVGANQMGAWVIAGLASVESVSREGNHGRGAARPYPGTEGRTGAFWVRGPLPFEVIWVSYCLKCVDKQGFGDLFTCGTWRRESGVPCPLRWIF